MRRILVDNARRKQTAKHGGGRQRLEADEGALAAPESEPDLIALDAADSLGGTRPNQGEACRTPLFCRIDRRSGGRGLGDLGLERGSALDVHAGLASPGTGF
jgi:hypothetical protein